MNKTTLTKEWLRDFVLSEVSKMKGFGKPKETSSVKPREVDADELASTLANKKDFTVKEQKQAIDIIESCKKREAALVAKLREIRSLRTRLSSKIIDLI